MSETKSSVLMAQIHAVLKAAMDKGEIHIPDNTIMVLVVQCPEPAAGEGMVAESVLRFGCDPCDAARLMAMAIVQHNERDHGDDPDEPCCDGLN